jgi:hypothetical protein
MKKFILTALSVVLVSTLVQSQNTWTKVDTIRVQVEFTGTEVCINPEPTQRLSDKDWNILIGDTSYTEIEDLRKRLGLYDFKSTSCYLDKESDVLVFYFEKVIVESETAWKREQ